MLGRIPYVLQLSLRVTHCTHTHTHPQLTESLAIGSREASGESCRDSTVRQPYVSPPPCSLLFCAPVLGQCCQPSR